MGFTLKSNYFTNKKYISIILVAMTFIAVLKQFLTHKINNYLIFKQVFFHLIEKKPLYIHYPAEYFDLNHYGPLFSYLIAPFAILPDYLGIILWGLFNTIVLIIAVNKLKIDDKKTAIVLWIFAHELLTTILGLQINPFITATIIFTFVYIDSGKDFWATFFIALATFIKLYGIVGLAFFFFSKNKPKFILYLAFWFVIMFVLPMAISSPSYIMNTYLEWYQSLVDKNNENASLTSMQDISVMGMYRGITHNPAISNLPFLLVGILLFLLPYIRLSMYSTKKFRLLLLSSTLIFTVIFSSSSESPTYIIAFLGIAIWFSTQENPISRYTLFLLIFAMILTSFSYSDLMPQYLRENYIKPYALKAFPCILIWLQIVYEMLTIKKLNEDTKSITV